MPPSGEDKPGVRQVGKQVGKRKSNQVTPYCVLLFNRIVEPLNLEVVVSWKDRMRYDREDREMDNRASGTHHRIFHELESHGGIPRDQPVQACPNSLSPRDIKQLPGIGFDFLKRIPGHFLSTST